MNSCCNWSAVTGGFLVSVSWTEGITSYAPGSRNRIRLLCMVGDLAEVVKLWYRQYRNTKRGLLRPPLAYRLMLSSVQLLPSLRKW